MVSYHSQLITAHNSISDVFKAPESCGSGRGQTGSQRLYSPPPPLPFQPLSRCHFSSGRSFMKEERVAAVSAKTNTLGLGPGPAAPGPDRGPSPLVASAGPFKAAALLPLRPHSCTAQRLRVQRHARGSKCPPPTALEPCSAPLTCLDAAVEVSCRPSQGPAATSTLMRPQK